MLRATVATTERPSGPEPRRSTMNALRTPNSRSDRRVLETSVASWRTSGRAPDLGSLNRRS